jgi:hypothetical protein
MLMTWSDDVVCHRIVLLAVCEQVVSLADEDTVSTLLSLYISCVKQVNSTSLTCFRCEVSIVK